MSVVVDLDEGDQRPVLPAPEHRFAVRPQRADRTASSTWRPKCPDRWRARFGPSIRRPHLRHAVRVRRDHPVRQQDAGESQPQRRDQPPLLQPAGPGRPGASAPPRRGLAGGGRQHAGRRASDNDELASVRPRAGVPGAEPDVDRLVRVAAHGTDRGATSVLVRHLRLAAARRRPGPCPRVPPAWVSSLCPFAPPWLAGPIGRVAGAAAASRSRPDGGQPTGSGSSRGPAVLGGLRHPCPPVQPPGQAESRHTRTAHAAAGCRARTAPRWPLRSTPPSPRGGAGCAHAGNSRTAKNPHSPCRGSFGEDQAVEVPGRAERRDRASRAVLGCPVAMR